MNDSPIRRGLAAAAGAALVAAGLRRRTAGGAALAPGGVGLLYRGATGTSRRNGRRVEIQRSITVHKPLDEVYAGWRDPRSQPLVWAHFAELTNATEQGAHWLVRAPLGRTLEWDARIVEERPPELVRWAAAEGGDLPNEGSVEFRGAPGEWGTELTLRVRFDPPAGPVGDVAARVFGDAPKLVLEKALRRFKSLVETGEIPTTERNPSARAS